MKPLILDEKLLKNSEALYSFIESHYIRGGAYKLQFPVQNLFEVEKIFDRVIRKHGIYKASFDFEILRDN